MTRNIIRQDAVISLRINIGILVLISIVAAGLILAFVFYEEQQETIKFVAGVIGGGAAVYAAFYTGKSIKYNRHRQRQESAYKILDSLNALDSVKVRDVINEATKEKLSSIELYEKASSDPILRKDIMTLLGIFEDLSIAIQTDYADEEILYRSLSAMVPYYFENLRGYVEELRNKTNEKRYYHELEELSNAWKAEKSIVDQRSMKDV